MITTTDTLEELAGPTPQVETDAAPEHAQRHNGIAVGGNTITQATAHLPEEHKNLVRWLHDHARHMGWNWGELETAVGLERSTLNRVFRDAYRNEEGQRVPLDKICAKIKRLKRDESNHGKIANPNFLKTEVFDQLNWLYGRCHRNQRLAFAYSTAQIGKTTCLKEITRLNNGGQTTYVELPPVAGCNYMLQVIAKALKVSPKHSYDKNLENVIAALDESKVLILDEVHRIFTNYREGQVMRCLDTIRYIFDQSGCGMILCGTDVFRDQIRAGDFHNYLKQLYRRGRSYELQLPPQPFLRDLQMAWEKFGLDAPKENSDVEHLVYHIAKEDGFGVFMLRLRDSVDHARGKTPTWKNFTEAYAITEKAAKLPLNAAGQYEPEY